MKRLLCVVGGMNAGGAESFLMKIYRALDKRKYQMDFAVNIDTIGFYDEEIKRLGGKIYHFPNKTESFFGYIKGLWKIVRENRYESVLRITSNAMGFLDLAIAKAAGAKKCIARSSNSSDGGGAKTLVAHRIGRFLFKRFVDVEIAPSKKAALYTFGKKDVALGKVCILANGFDLEYYSFDKEKREKIRTEFGIDSGCYVLGHVGRFCRQKNHSFLIDVFAELHRQIPNSKLLLVGDGELRDDIIAKTISLGLRDFVIIAGIRSDMPSLYSAMDVFVFPSLFEGMPNAVLEAQACGLSCVLSDSITKEADLTRKLNYLPIETDSVLEWVKCIRKIPNDRIVNGLSFSDFDIRKVVADFQGLM